MNNVNWTTLGYYSHMIGVMTSEKSGNPESRAVDCTDHRSRRPHTSMLQVRAVESWTDEGKSRR